MTLTFERISSTTSVFSAPQVGWVVKLELDSNLGWVFSELNMDCYLTNEDLQLISIAMTELNNEFDEGVK